MTKCKSCIHYGVCVHRRELNDFDVNHIHKCPDFINKSDITTVKRGIWVADDYMYYHCSECRYEYDEREYTTPFCPGCGAEMDEQESQCIAYAKHAIGLDYKKPYHRHGRAFYKPYRNYFCTVKDDKLWNKLESAGYAVHSNERNGFVDFVLTRDGLDWLGDELGIIIYD